MSHKRKNNSRVNGFSSQSKRSRLTNGNESISSGDPEIRINDAIAEVGIIESLSMKNFMCHSTLNFKFGPNVNFVMGRNGSGKSAILTAIIVGLGGKANVTNRANSVKDFIKNGKNSAEVQVRLRNCGTDAYKPDLYGDSILVERHLYQDGTSTYKLRGKDNQVVSTKKEELSHILDQFNIQVDNPVSILNQEVSRNFLHSKSAHDKYKFFLKATHLEQMDNDYNAADEQKRIADDVLKRKMEIIPDLEKEVDEWRRKYQRHQQLDKLREQLVELKKEISWAQVAELEKELEARARKLAREESRIPKFEEKIQQAKEKEEQARKKCDELNLGFNKINEAFEKIKPQRVESKERYKTEKEAYKKLVLENRKCISEIKSCEAEKKEIEKRISELRSTLEQAAVEADRRQWMEDISAKETEKKDLEDRRRTTQHHLEQLHNSITKYNEDMYNMGEEDRRIRRAIADLRQDLRNIESSRNNALERFGRWVPELKSKIDNAFNRRMFKHKPIGPLGSCIKLRDAKWALAVETCVGSMLHAFWVDNHEDERVLETLMREMRNLKRPSIIVSKYQSHMHDVRRNSAASRDFQTVLDVLEFEDPMVANCFIDRHSVESTLLIESNKKAREVMSSDNPPQRCRVAFTLEGDQVFPKPGYKYYSNTRQSHAPLLQPSLEDSVNSIRAEIEANEREQKRVQAEINIRKTQFEENKTEQRRTESDLSGLRKAISQLHMEIVNLREIITDEPEPGDLNELQTELIEKDAELEEATARQSVVAAEMNKKRETVQKIEEELKECEAKMDQIMNSRIEPFKAALANAARELANMEVEPKHYQDIFKNHQKDIKRSKEEKDEIEKVVQETICVAEQVCERIETNRPAKEVDGHIEQVKKTLERSESDRGTREEVTTGYFEAKKRFDKLRKDIQEVEIFNRKLQQIMGKRRGNYLEYRLMLSVRVNQLFTMMLDQRNFQGQMIFDHNRELLIIKALPSQTISDSKQDVRSLSGGERSFSTVSFILALWDAMESPFRILDEFDVFMDMVTRRISMDMILETAVSKSNCQFCILTPLELPKGGLKNTRKIKVFKMADPDRQLFGQTQQSTWDDEEDVDGS